MNRQDESPIASRALRALAWLVVRWVTFALYVVVLLPAANGADVAGTARAKRVLIISTGSRFSPGFVLVEQSAVEALRQLTPDRIEFYSEHLDIIQFSGESYQRLFREYLREKYAGQPPDLLMLFYVGNLRIAGRLLEQLFPGVPVVVGGLTEEEVPAGQLGSQISGLGQRLDLRGTIELILRLQPETRRIVVIGGAAEVDRDVLGQAENAARSFTGQVEFDFWTKRPMAEIRRAVASLPPHTAVLFTRMYRDGVGQTFIPAQAAQLIAESANVPVYVMADTMLGTGAVGGSVVDVGSMGKRVGELAHRVLSGAAPASFPIEIRTDGVPIFDWRALQRWGIGEGRLPPNSIIRFRSPSVWEQYHWYILGALVIIAMQMVLIVGLLVQRARRRRAEAELRESQQFMELATSAGELGLWAHDLAGGDVWANAALRSLFGFGQNDPLRLSDMLARTHPNGSARVTSQVEPARETDLPFEGEFRTVLPDGRERWVLAKGKTVDDRRGRGVRRMGVMMDITERKRAEEGLRESESRFRVMADTAPVMIWMSGPDRLCIFFNKGWLDFTGRTLEQELGNGWAEGVHRENFDRCLGVYSNAFDARREFTMEYRLRRSDGEYRWVLDHGVPRFASDGAFLGYIGTAIDITELKRAEEKFRLAVEASPSAIVMVNQQGRIVLVNVQTEKLFGYAREELIGQPIEMLVPERLRGDRPAHRAEFLMGMGRDQFARRKDGNEVAVEIGLNPIETDEGVLVLTAIADITERKRAESELQRNRQELAHVARLSAMGELAASLAHELNQPLTAILSNAQAAQHFLAAKPSNLAEVREILKDIVQDNNRASEVIRRMRALVMKEELEFAPLDLAGVINDVVALAHSDAILHNIHVLIQFNPGVPLVRGDKVQLQQVILNLLLNAFDAMKDCPAHERRVGVLAQVDGGGLVRVALRDRGTGLSSDKLNKIFEPFYTTKRDGLGMGLSISRSIIESHGGRLWAENNSDRGATFYFTVPVEEGGDVGV